MLGFLTSVLKVPHRGISIPDAQTLAHVFLFELAENVSTHAQVPYGLLAVWARPAFKQKPQFFEQAIRTAYRESELEFGRWASVSPVVEVVVGDSGKGIPGVLGEEFDRSSSGLTKALGDLGDFKGKLSRSEQVMFWSLDKWSSSVLHGPQRGTRGLYRVQRVVGKWEGCLTVRAETSLIGLNCKIGASDRHIVEKKRLARIPGTIVHLRLPARCFPEPVVLPNSVRKQRFVTAEFDQSPDIKVAAEKTIRAVAELSRVYGQSALIIVDLGFRPLHRHQLEPMLSQLIQVAHPTAVVLANLGEPGWQSFLQSADSIEDGLFPVESARQGEVQYEATSIRNVVLVVHESGNAKWIGHRSWLCRVLDRLLRTEELRKEDILSEVRETHSADQTLRDLWEQSHVVDGTANGAFKLRFDLEDVVGQLTERMSLDLQQRIKSGKPPAVYRNGIFVTPSQRRVHSYIRTDELLAGDLRRHAMGLLALQTKLRLRAAGAGDSIISIVTDEGKARGLADSLRERLGEAEIQPVAAYSRVGRLLATMSVPSTHQVIIFTDLISTGSLVRSLLDRANQNNLEPFLVACVVDARQTPDEHIALNGRTIPVLSLTHVDLTPDKRLTARQKPVRINPVTGWPEFELVELDYELSPDRLDAMIIASDAMYFTHVIRSDWRHFTMYLDALRLLGRDEVADEILEAFRRVIERWQKENNITHLDGVLYPQTVDEAGGAPTATETIAQGLRKTYGLLPDQIRTIPRKHGATEFAFGDTVQDSWGTVSEEAPADSSVDDNLVLLDWGCITGQTALEMISSAASLGAKNALVVFFVSQLSGREERTLRAIKQVGESTRVSVRFVTKCRTWAYSRNDCPYCEQIRRFGEEMEKLNPPPFFKEFVAEARNDLEPKTLQEVRLQQETEASADFKAALQLSFESPSAGLVRMARFRELLREAESRNYERQLVLEHILSLRNVSATNRGCYLPDKGEITRLLASEWTLFERPPLKEEGVRAELARIALDIARDSSFPQRTRHSGIIALRTASADLFVQHLPELLVMMLPHQKLTKQLLYCTFTLLKARGAASVDRLPQIQTSLGIASNKTRELIGTTAEEYRIELLETLGFMYDLALHLGTRGVGSQHTGAEAWSLLRLQFGENYSSHHETCRPISALFQRALEEAIEEGMTPLPEVPWPTILAIWKAGEQLLHNSVLRYLPSLERFFTGKYARRRLGIDRASALSNTREVLQNISAIRTNLEGFAQDPEQVRVPGVWEEFRYSRDLLWDLILAHGTASGRRAAILEILDGCPFNLKNLPSLIDTIARVVCQHPFELDVRFIGQAFEESVRVFCHEEVLRECFHELFDNILKHMSAEENRRGGTVPVEIIADKARDAVVLTVRNQRTDPETGVGPQLGLTICREYLRGYEASLESISPQAPWTYAVTLTFREAY